MRPTKGRAELQPGFEQAARTQEDVLGDLVAHCLRFETKVERPIELGEPGSMLRGAVFHALRGRPERPGFCLVPGRSDCHDCHALAGCPVSFLLSTVDEAGRRGEDVPRPYTLEPPLGGQSRYEAGEDLTFGLTVFGRAVALFPYLIVAARRVEEDGLGHVDRFSRRRGRFAIERIVAANPLTGEEQVVLQSGDELVKVPATPVTHDQVAARARELARNGSITLYFLSPTRLVQEGRVLRRPSFRALAQRLIERLSSLWEHYAGAQLPIDYPAQMAQAERVSLIADGTRWVEQRGYSTRQHAPKHLDGFVGKATFAGVAETLLPLLVWSEIAHVGKDAVKGCGRLRVS